ncbi:MAG: glycosyltransferase [Candidatus Liptonbacteria bacterium]|nr:glycosyltransferase [Candidatus Liptonbacteria bacterium]
MKIAIFSDNFYPELSGISDSFITLAKELSKRGHFVNFYVPRYSAKNYQTAGIADQSENEIGKRVRVVRFSSISYPMPTTQGRLIIPIGLRTLSIKKFNPDVLHTQLFGGAGLEALIAGRILGRPVIGTNHTVVREFLRYSPIQNKSFLNLILRYVNWFYGKCDFLTSPSMFLIKDMEALGFSGNSAVVYNPVDTKFFRPLSAKNNNELKRKFGLAYPAVVYAGRFAPEKKMDVLFKAFGIVRKTIPSATLAVAGHGVTKDSLQSLSKTLGMEKNVVFTGTLSKPVLAELYHAAELSATASTSEVQSITMLEAMASGLPVVGVNARGLGEHINVKNGLLAEPDDPEDLARKILLLLKKDSLRKKLGAGAAVFAQNFTTERIATDWEQIYEKVIKNYTKRASAFNF